MYSYDETLICNIADDLGWPWSTEKHSPFTACFTYIGFLWSLETKTVELPKKKRSKYLAKLSKWSDSSKVSLKMTESLIGTLNHVCLVLPTGRSHLPSLFAFRARFPATCSKFVSLLPSKAVMEDIIWWRDTSEHGWCSSHVIQPPDPIDLDVYVDASTTWGIGFVADDRWLAWELRPGWKSDGRDIGWVEMVTVDLSVRALVNARFTNCHIVLKSDNSGVVGALTAGRSRSLQQNAILCRIVDTFQSSSIWLTIIWLPSASNKADRPSCRSFPSKRTLFPFPPRIPPYLMPFVHSSVRHSQLAD